LQAALAFCYLLYSIALVVPPTHMKQVFADIPFSLRAVVALGGQAEWQAPSDVSHLVWKTGSDASFWISNHRALNCWGCDGDFSNSEVVLGSRRGGRT